MRENPIEIKDVDPDLITDFINGIAKKHSKNKDQIYHSIIFTNLLAYVSVLIGTVIEYNFKDHSRSFQKKVAKQAIKTVKQVLYIMLEKEKNKGEKPWKH